MSQYSSGRRRVLAAPLRRHLCFCDPLFREGEPKPVATEFPQMTPYAIMASPTLTKPAMLAPLT